MPAAELSRSAPAQHRRPAAAAAAVGSRVGPEGLAVPVGTGVSCATFARWICADSLLFCLPACQQISIWAPDRATRKAQQPGNAKPTNHGVKTRNLRPRLCSLLRWLKNARMMEGYCNLLVDSVNCPQPSIVTFSRVLSDLKQIQWGSYKTREDLENRFDSDPQVVKHVADIVELELETGVYSESHAEQRRHQLTSWFREYYSKQLSAISNIGTTTRNHLLYLHSAFILFRHILPTIFKDGIWIRIDTFNSFKQRSAGLKEPLLLLPDHKSHFDYIMIHYLYVLAQLDTPLVIAGDNLNVPVFGHCLKRLGAIYIRRRFTKDDSWYSSNMRHLLSDKLQSNPQIELFIEGTRSRNGKLMLPKTGFMQLMKDALDGKDASIQPISLVYEKPFEFEEYLVELNGMDKKQESFRSILSSGLNLLLRKKSPNFGKLVINFDHEFLRMNRHGDVKDICALTMRRIHQIGHITEISVLGLAMCLIFYKDVHVKKLDIQETVSLVRFLVTRLLIKSTENDHLGKMLEMDDPSLAKFCCLLLTKFLDDYVVITDSSFVIIEETALVYFKNSLLNHFISEMFLLKTKHKLSTLHILRKLFEYEFLTATIDESTEITPQCAILSKLLDPFIESYEVVLKNLQGVLTITLKAWLHLLYLSSPNVTYKESMNKSNLLYALYTLQSLKLIKITQVDHLQVLDEEGLKLFKVYLQALREGQALPQEETVFQIVIQSHPNL